MRLLPVIAGLALAVFLSLLTGCAFNKPTGAAFSLQMPSSPDKALVYFYRPRGESFGYDRTYYVAVNQRKVVNLLHGGYFPYEANPGKLALLSDVNVSGRQFLPDILILPAVGTIAEAAANAEAAKLDIEVEAGKTYYVRMHPDTSFTHFTPRLTLMTNEAGETEIAGCKLIKN